MKYFIFFSIKYCSIQVFLQALHSGTYLKPQAILEACLQTLARYCVKNRFFYIILRWSYVWIDWFLNYFKNSSVICSTDDNTQSFTKCSHVLRL